MNLQDQIDQFQKLVFANFRPSSNNECRIAALVPLVEETYAIYKFATSMLRAMHKRKNVAQFLASSSMVHCDNQRRPFLLLTNQSYG